MRVDQLKDADGAIRGFKSTPRYMLYLLPTGEIYLDGEIAGSLYRLVSGELHIYPINPVIALLMIQRKLHE